jgi:Flp pilus assembly protein CpaB
MNVPRTAPLALAALLSSVAIPVAGREASAATARRQTATKTCSIPAGTTRTCELRYPDAKKFPRARYAGRAQLLLARRLRPGERQPDLRRVKFLFTGSVRGGTVFRVKVRNRNDARTAAARVRLRATTTH